MRSLVLLLLALSLIAPAQTRKRPAPKTVPAPVASSFPLVRLTVTGNRLYSEQAIVAASGMKLGQPVTKENFEKARDRLVATGAFQTVGFEFGPDAGGKGYQGKFEVAEIEQRYPIRFEELPGTEAEVRAFLREREPLFGTEIPGTTEVLSRFSRELTEWASARGLKEKVVGRVINERANELTVLFRPTTLAPVIADVHFQGNQAIASPVLSNALSEVAIGVVYSEPRIRDLLDGAIRPLYEAKGRLRVTFPKIESKPSSSVKGLSVTIQVDEGPVYQFGTIVIDSKTIRPDELMKASGLKAEAPADFDAVKAAQEAIKERFRRLGYMEMTSTVERKIDDKAKTVDLVIHTAAGPQFKMGKLKIEGLDIISEPAVRKLWGMKEGAPFDDTYPDTFLRRIKEDGYFDDLKSTRFSNDLHRDDNTVDVTLVFVGGPDHPAEGRHRRSESPF